MKKKQYIQPDTVCDHFSDGQLLMAGSISEVKVSDEVFDPENMESLSRSNHAGLWDEE
jgi:hypothetical protein